MDISMRMGKVPFEWLSLEQSDQSNVTGTNSGNMLFAQAVYKTVSAPDVKIHKHPYGADAARADEINERYDSLVLPMANSFRGDFIPPLDRYTALIEKLKIPVIVVGVGAQCSIDYNLNDLKPIEKATKRFVSAVLDRSATIGVRGECTAAFLNRLGFGSNQVDVIGCPSMFIHGNRLRVDLAKGKGLSAASKISLNVTSTLQKQQFRTGEDRILALADRHLKEYPNSILVPQESRSLSTMIWGEWLGKGIEYDGVSPESRRALAAGRAMFFVDPNTWIDALRSADFAIGSRLHGSIAAILAGTPAMMIAMDSRTRELGEFFSIPWKRIGEIGDAYDVIQASEEADFSDLHRKHAGLFDYYLNFIRKNGLPCIYDNAGAEDAFDRRLAQARLAPPAVGVTNSPLRRGLFHARSLQMRIGSRLRRG